jgi:hypothetical protein
MAARMTIRNFERWGKLIKTWATGTDYLHDGNFYPVPKTRAEFREQMNDSGAGDIPDEILSIQFMQTNRETLLIVLPRKEDIESVEQKIADGPYMLPKFYAEACKTPLNVTDTLDAKMKFGAERLGEFMICLCG